MRLIRYLLRAVRACAALVRLRFERFGFERFRFGRFPFVRLRLVFLSLLAASLLLAFSCSPGGGSKEGKTAPDFVLNSLDGKQITLSQYRGKVVILDFWATWCKPCRLEIPHLIELRNEYASQGFEIIGISLDRGGTAEVAAFVKELRIPYPVVIGNGEVVGSYGGIRGIPTTFVIDKHGVIFKKYIGYRTRDVFERDIKRLLQEA